MVCAEILLISFSIFGKVAFLLIQASFGFRESRVILTNLSFLWLSQQVIKSIFRSFCLPFQKVQAVPFLSTFLALFVPYFGSGSARVFLFSVRLSSIGYLVSGLLLCDCFRKDLQILRLFSHVFQC